MKKQVAVGIVAIALIGGAATGLVVREVRSEAADTTSATSPPTSPATSDATPTATPTASDPEPTPESSESPEPTAPDLLPLGRLQINTGAVGPVRVGMTTAQAAATGYFNTDVPTEVCEATRPLEWKSNYFNALDVYVGRSGTITSIGVLGRGPTTRSGLGVNSSYREVREVVGDATPERAGYGQTGVFVNDGDAWIGFLFDTTPAMISDSDPVTFIEVTRGRKPALMRDGC